MRSLSLRARRARPRRDPAPSVWAYRYQRLLLTPLYRRTVRVVLPLALSLAVGLAWLNTGDHRERLMAGIEDLKDSVREREAFMVRALEVEGADAPLAAAIVGLMALDLPLSSFDLDLDAHRAAIADLAPVRDVALRLHPGGVLEVDVEQRQPVAVWRHADGLRLIDPEGVMTGMIAERGDRADLPLIAGDGAHEAIGEALALFAAAAPVAPRVRGLVRMGERRWDMVLDDVRVLLPAEGAVVALERVVALQQAQDLLDRDVAAVDMRLGHRPTIRLRQPALNVLRAGTSADTLSQPPIPED